MRVKMLCAPRSASPPATSQYAIWLDDVTRPASRLTRAQTIMAPCTSEPNWTTEYGDPAAAAPGRLRYRAASSLPSSP